MHNINGLIYIENFLSSDLCDNLISIIDSYEWNSELKRRTQQYGYKYNYKSKDIDNADYLGLLPNFINIIIEKLTTNNLINEIPNQVIVNEYLPGQSIAPHIDCIPCFKNCIITLSLGSQCEMEFVNIETKQKVNIILSIGSILIFKDEARYKWTHCIKSRLYDNNIKRERRISVTLRNVIKNKKEE